MRYILLLTILAASCGVPEDQCPELYYIRYQCGSDVSLTRYTQRPMTWEKVKEEFDLGYCHPDSTVHAVLGKVVHCEIDIIQEGEIR